MGLRHSEESCAPGVRRGGPGRRVVGAPAVRRFVCARMEGRARPWGAPGCPRTEGRARPWGARVRLRPGGRGRGCGPRVGCPPSRTNSTRMPARWRRTHVHQVHASDRTRAGRDAPVHVVHAVDVPALELAASVRLVHTCARNRAVARPARSLTCIPCTRRRQPGRGAGQSTVGRSAHGPVACRLPPWDGLNSRSPARQNHPRRVARRHGLPSPAADTRPVTGPGVARRIPATVLNRGADRAMRQVPCTSAADGGRGVQDQWRAMRGTASDRRRVRRQLDQWRAMRGTASDRRGVSDRRYAPPRRRRKPVVRAGSTDRATRDPVRIPGGGA